MKKYFILFCLVLSTSVKAQSSGKLKIGLLSNDNSKLSGEYSSAKNYLEAQNNFEFEEISFEQLSGKTVSTFGMIWFHRPDSSEFSEHELNQNSIDIIKNFVKEGGGLLLTLDAAFYAFYLGIESNKPELRNKTCSDNGYGYMLGLHAFKNHPLFNGLNGGSYILKPAHDINVRQIGYFENNLPKEGKVAGVDWDYIFLRENKKLIIEHSFGKGKIVSVGGYTLFDIENVNRQHLEKFMSNAFHYLSNNYSGEVNYWTFSEQSVKENDKELNPIKFDNPKDWDTQPSEIQLTRNFASENYFDLAGERILIIGNEQSGINEVWTHPFMAFRDYEVGIQFSYADSIHWLKNERPRVEVDPESFRRIYKFKRAYLTELISVDVKNPQGVVHYEYRGVYPAQLFVKFKSNLRIMWPYSEKVNPKINYSFSKKSNFFFFTNKDEDLSAILGSNKLISNHLIGRYSEITFNDSSFNGNLTEEFLCSAAFSINLDMNDNVDVIFSGTDQSITKTVDYFSQAAFEPKQIYKNSKQYYEALLKEKLMFDSPDDEFDLSYKWAAIGSDKFMVNTPELGKALVAGYAGTDKGWDGEHEVNGRPGYSWYFGRDSEWSAFAFLSFGEFQKVRENLEFLQKYQDLNGKIFHELTTSGFVHYDASDATPLYLILMGRYLRYTGDLEFVQKYWEHVEAAMKFLLSTDTDHDNLIENTNVGHGWVEGGALFGSHTSLYLASCWAEALREYGFMADALGKPGEYKKSKNLYDVVINQINNKFWNEGESYLYHGMFRDNSFHQEKTIMPSIPMLFGQLDDVKTNVMLEDFASYEYTSDWGVRIVGRSSSFFRPNGYHTGSVWPLFTGWVSLAEFRSGRYLQGFTHLKNNLNVYKNWSLGYIEEVLNGEIYEPSGVCAHQCWSQTMAVQPAIEGMLGLSPDAIIKKLSISPRIPFDWNFLNVSNIKFAEHSIDFNFQHSKNINRYKFSKKENVNIQISFTPVFPAGTKVEKVLIDGNEIEFNVFNKSQSVEINLSFDFGKQVEIEIHFQGGIGLLPVIPKVIPGRKTELVKIINSELIEDDFIISLEGKSKSDCELKLFSNFDIVSIEGADVIKTPDNIYKIKTTFEESNSDYIEKQITVKISR
ncbi:MAG: hypothetical protein J5I57_03475 [Melioribacteraceae bacterium]|nr:hypothetical protein [Melioribacteraceae bacterium]